MFTEKLIKKILVKNYIPFNSNDQKNYGTN